MRGIATSLYYATFLGLAAVSGANPSSVPSRAPASVIAEINIEATTLFKDLRALVTSTHNKSNPPGAAKVAAFENHFAEFKTQLETALSGDLPAEAKQTYVQYYLDRVQELTALRIALSLPHDPLWQNQWGLKLTTATLKTLPGIIAGSSRSAIGQQSFAYITKNIGEGEISIHLSATTVQGLELAKLAENPNSSSFLTLVKFLAILQLEQNLSTLHQILPGQTSAAQIEVPKELKQQLQSFGALRTLRLEHDLRVQEALDRPALLITFESIATELPALDNAAFLKVLSQETRGQISPHRISQNYRELWTKTALSRLEAKIVGAPKLLTSLSDADYLDFLRQTLVAAQMETFVDSLRTFQVSGELKITEASQLARWNNLIAKHETQFSAQISDDLLMRWRSIAAKTRTQKVNLERRDRLTSELIEQAAQLADRYQKLTALSEIDLATLSKSIAPKIESLNMRLHIRSAYAGILSQRDYLSARDEYTRYLVNLSSPEVTREGLADPELLSEFIRTHNFTPTDPGFSPHLNPELKRLLLNQAANARKKDLQDWIKVGNAYGFLSSFANPIPTVQDLIRNSNDWNAYVEARRQLNQNDHPLLTAWVEGKPLYQQLVAIHMADDKSARAAAQRFIDAALISTQQKILSDVNRVAQARQLSEIESVATGSLILQLVFDSYPEFIASQEEFVSSLLTQSLQQRLVHRYVGPTLSTGFGGLMLLQGARWFIKPAAPFAEVLMKATGPFTASFFKASLGLLGVDTYVQTQDLISATQRAESSEAFASADITGSSLVSVETAENSRRLQMFEAGALAFRLTLDSLFMYLPVGSQFANAIQHKVTLAGFRGDIKAFQKLGITPGEWTRVQSAYDQGLGKLQVGSLERSDFERAYRRLHDKSRAGRQWSLKSSAPARGPASASQATHSFEQELSIYLESSNRLVKQLTLKSLDDILQNEIGTPSYVEHLRQIETFADQNPEPIFDLIRFLQLRWEQRYAHNLMGRNLNKKKSGQIGTLVGASILGLGLVRRPDKLPTYLAFIRHLFPLSGAGAGLAAANIKEEEIPPSPAHILRLGFSDRGPESLLLDSDVQSFISISSGVVAGAWVAEAQKCFRMIKIANAVTTPLKWNPYVFAASLAVGVGVEIGAQTLLNQQIHHHFQMEIESALQRMDLAFELNQSAELYVAAEQWTRAVTDYSAYLDTPLIDALSTYEADSARTPAHSAKQRTAAHHLAESTRNIDLSLDSDDTADLLPGRVEYLKGAHKIRSGNWGSNGSQLLFRAAGVLAAYGNPYLDYQIEILLNEKSYSESLSSAVTQFRENP